MAGQHLELVDCFRQKFPNVCYGLNEWRQYIDPGVWHPHPESLVRRALIAISREHTIKCTAPIISSTLSLLRDEVFVPAGAFNSTPNLIPLTNGVLEIDTRTLRSFRPTDYITSTLPFEYNASAKSTSWERVLVHIDPLVQGFLQEWAGLCLTPDTHHELAVWLYGPPRGGKSTFIEGLQTMLGSKSTVLGLDEIARSPFALAQIVGKNLLVCTEQPAELLKYTHTYIKLISGEAVTINPKHQPAFEYRPHAKIISAMNQMPSVDSASVGLYRRLAPVYWPPVPDSALDITIKETISAQGPAILNWALDGLDRLISRGRFDLPKCVEDARGHYQARHNNIMAFIEECCQKDTDARVQASSLYAQYQLWCALNDRECAATNKFFPEVDQLFPYVKPNNVKHYLGLTLLEPPADPTN